MTCPSCHKETQPTLFCHACDAFIADSTAGIKASVARRFFAQVLDSVVLWVVFFGVLFISTTLGVGGGYGTNSNPNVGAFFGTFLSTFLLAAAGYAVFSLWFLAQG